MFPVACLTAMLSMAVKQATGNKEGARDYAEEEREEGGELGERRRGTPARTGRHVPAMLCCLRATVLLRSPLWVGLIAPGPSFSLPWRLLCGRPRLDRRACAGGKKRWRGG